MKGLKKAPWDEMVPRSLRSAPQKARRSGRDDNDEKIEGEQRPGSVWREKLVAGDGGQSDSFFLHERVWREW